MVTSVPVLIARIPDDNDFLRLKEMANIHDDWNLDYDKNGIKIWSKVVPEATIKMIKVWSIFSAVSSVDLYNTLMDTKYRKEWDPHMITGYDIGHLNPNNGVSYYAVSCPPPLRSRDFVLQTSWLDRGTEHFIINHSICHKDHPPRSGYIRAISYFTGYFIKCLPINGCEMSFVSQTDPQGIIPSWIVNKCTQIFAPKFVKQLEKAAFGYSEWKSQHDPEFFPWTCPEQMISPKISIDDCVPNDEERLSPFFKYLSEKAAKTPHQPGSTEEVPIRVQFSSPIIPSTSDVSYNPVSESSQPMSSTGINTPTSSDTEKEKKSGKSKRSSWLDFAKTCFGKNSES